MALNSPPIRPGAVLVCAVAVLLMGQAPDHQSPRNPPPESAQALFDRGVSYDYNGEKPPDPAAAFDWYLKAAHAGSAKGAFNVAVMYDAGRGVAHDPTAAATWYAIAAALLEPRAAYNLGELYENGEGVPKNPTLSAAWYRRAAGFGLAAATGRLHHLQPAATSASARNAPPPAQAIAPADAATEQPMSGGIVLVWTASPWPDVTSFYVEVTAIGAGQAKDVFTAITGLSSLRVPLPPGNYAWRVLTLDPLGAHYTANGWTRFSLQGAA